MSQKQTNIDNPVDSFPMENKNQRVIFSSHHWHIKTEIRPQHFFFFCELSIREVTFDDVLFSAIKARHGEYGDKTSGIDSSYIKSVEVHLEAE